MKLPKVTIKNYSLNHVGYFDWLVTGLGLMSQKNELSFGYDLSPAKYLLRDRFVRWGIKSLHPSYAKSLNDCHWWLEGEMEIGGKIASFVFDVHDDPDKFAERALEECDIYFKCQMHQGFPDDLIINQYVSRSISSVVKQNAHKVRPAMLGRPLSRSLHFHKNLKVLKNWEREAKTIKNKRVFAYFGGDVVGADVTECKLKLHHPNFKRSRLVRYLRSLRSLDVDARLVHSLHSDLVGPALKCDKIYARHVADAAYNLNVSGLSLSMPFRFIDSFMLGTAVATDNLSVRWYEPFDQIEVNEIGRMGYELEDEVDWPSVEKKILDLILASEQGVEARSKHILDRYEKYWSPLAFARYVVKELAQER